MYRTNVKKLKRTVKPANLSKFLTFFSYTLFRGSLSILTIVDSSSHLYFPALAGIFCVGVQHDFKRQV